MATKTAKKKQIKKKAVIKKKTVAKKIVAKKKVVKKKTVEPLEKFEDYRINRDQYRVSFGCGEVPLLKADLKLLADTLEKGGDSLESLMAFQRIAQSARNRRTPEQILNISAETLRRIIGN